MIAGGVCSVSILAMAVSLFAQQPQLARPMDVFGGISSSRVVVRLKADAFQRINLARAGVVADANVLPRMSARLRTIAANRRATGMRRLYLQPFADPALAEKHALDRTFVLEVPSGTNTETLAAAIAAVSNDVEFATTDVIGGVAADPLIPSDTQFGMQWGMNNTGQLVSGLPGSVDSDIDAPEAWAIHTGDIGAVTVAVIDSGVNSHPEYGNNVPPYPNGRIVQGYNTVLNSSDYRDLQDACSPAHGTPIAGIIAAGGNNNFRCSTGSVNARAVCTSAADCQRACIGGTNAGRSCSSNGDCPNGTCAFPTCDPEGVAGVSWGAYIMPVRVLTGCDGHSSDVAEGIIWAADDHLELGVRHADIINISLQANLTTPAQITLMQDAINYAHGRGVLLVGAAGNSDNCGFGVVCYPAKAANVLAVSATDNHDNFASFSNFGPEIDVCAPGKDIWSTSTNGSYANQFGTSIAAPHVAGLAALVKSYVPELTNDQIAEIIMSTAEDRGPPGWDDHYGFGRINAYQALKAAELWPGVLGSDPPDGAIDARQPLDPTGTIGQGWFEIVITFPRNLGGVASADFAVTQTVAGAAPVVVDVQPIDVDRMRVVLEPPIEPLAWTTITHVPTATRIRLGFLPGDVDGDRTSAPVDILALIDSLNGVGPTLSIWSTDIDRSALAAPVDILQEIDLLNGAGPYDLYNGATLPPMP
jgi:subtilisin family serine protease